MGGTVGADFPLKHPLLGRVWHSSKQLQILKNSSTPIFSSQTPHLQELQVRKKHGSSSQLHQFHGAPQGVLWKLKFCGVGGNYPLLSSVTHTPTTRDWTFYDNFYMTNHFLVIKIMRLWQFFNGWQAFMTKLCFSHKQPSPCALPNLCENSTWRKWSNVHHELKNIILQVKYFAIQIFLWTRMHYIII